jgi:hypothetical protein
MLGEYGDPSAPAISGKNPWAEADDCVGQAMALHAQLEQQLPVRRSTPYFLVFRCGRLCKVELKDTVII